MDANSQCPTSQCPKTGHQEYINSRCPVSGHRADVNSWCPTLRLSFFIFFGLNWGELPSVLCCARILVCVFGFAVQINLGSCWGEPFQSVAYLGGDTMPGQGLLQVPLCRRIPQGVSLWFLSRCAVPS